MMVARTTVLGVWAVHDVVASRLGLTAEELERESLRLFLEHRLRIVDTQLWNLARRYGVGSVAELDRLIQAGQFHEEEAFEDYFEFDHLEGERDAVLGALREVA
jgi:hypothetical protein